MPKRYKIEMTLTEEKGSTPDDRAAFKVDYDTVEEAKQDFAKKVKAARETGKPPV
jgi:hypothetical protein